MDAWITGIQLLKPLSQLIVELMHIPILKSCVSFFSFLLIGVTSSHAQELSDLAKGQEFMYCGRLNMFLLQGQADVAGDPQKYKQLEKNAYTQMLMTAGAYLPPGTLNAEFSSAAARLSKEVQDASETENMDKGATGRFLKARYDHCRSFEERHVPEALAKFAAQAAARRAVPTTVAR